MADLKRGDGTLITAEISAGDNKLREQKLLRPQLLDRIPEFGSFLELEAFGGFAHVAFEFADVSVQFGLGLELGNAFGFSGGKVGVVGGDDACQRHIERPDDRLRRDSVRNVVGLLNGAAAVGFAHGFFNGVGHAIGLEEGTSVEVTGTASDGLDERSCRTQKTFFVGVEDGYQRNFGQVQTFAQEIDANQYVELALAQVAKDFNSLQSFNLGMHVAALHTDLAVIFCEIFGHAFSQRCDQHTLAA